MKASLILYSLLGTGTIGTVVILGGLQADAQSQGGGSQQEAGGPAADQVVGGRGFEQGRYTGLDVPYGRNPAFGLSGFGRAPEHGGRISGAFGFEEGIFGDGRGRFGRDMTGRDATGSAGRLEPWWDRGPRWDPSRSDASHWDPSRWDRSLWGNSRWWENDPWNKSDPRNDVWNNRRNGFFRDGTNPGFGSSYGRDRLE